MKKYMYALAFFAFALSGQVYADYPSSFNNAKSQMWQVYKDNRFDQYCGCPLGKGNRPDLQACGYESRKNLKRASRSEAEHVVPAENLGRQFACWGEGRENGKGGRDHCNATDQAFRNAHNDLHNLMPVVGEVNGDRSNFRFGEIQAPYNQYGQCQFKVDFSGRVAEPPPHMKGDIARIHFYMRDVHGLRLSDTQTKLYNAWNNMDPVSQWEITRDSRIEKAQGNSNYYVSGRKTNPPSVAPMRRPAQNGYKPYQSPIQAPATTSSTSGKYDCERKTCGAMASCEEAVHKLQQCGHKQLDRDGDGVPCEAICK